MGWMSPLARVLLTERHLARVLLTERHLALVFLKDHYLALVRHQAGWIDLWLDCYYISVFRVRRDAVMNGLVELWRVRGVGEDRMRLG